MDLTPAAPLSQTRTCVIESAGQSARLLKPSPCIAALDGGATKEATAVRIKATAISFRFLISSSSSPFSPPNRFQWGIPRFLA